MKRLSLFAAIFVLSLGYTEKSSAAVAAPICFGDWIKIADYTGESFLRGRPDLSFRQPRSNQRAVVLDRSGDWWVVLPQHGQVLPAAKQALTKNTPFRLARVSILSGRMTTQMLHTHPIASGSSSLTNTHGQVTLWGFPTEAADNNDNWRITALAQKTVRDNMTTFTPEADAVANVKVGHSVKIQHLNTGMFLNSTNKAFPPSNEGLFNAGSREVTTTETEPNSNAKMFEIVSIIRFAPTGVPSANDLNTGF